jgi:dUTP pyrophosphatase
MDSMIYFTKVRNVKNISGNRDEDAGYDFYIPTDWNNGKDYKLYVGEQINIPSGIKIYLKKSTMFLMLNKSGVALKKGLSVGACVIDESYRGEIHINLFKCVKGLEDKKDENGWYTILRPGEKIVQGVICNISNESFEEIDNPTYSNLFKTNRGSNGFGSTGV